MKNSKIHFCYFSFILFSLMFSSCIKKDKSIQVKLESRELVSGENLIFSNNEMDLYANVKDNTVQYYGKNKAGEIIEIELEKDVFAQASQGGPFQLTTPIIVECDCVKKNRDGKCIKNKCKVKESDIFK